MRQQQRRIRIWGGAICIQIIFVGDGAHFGIVGSEEAREGIVRERARAPEGGVC